MLQKVTTVTENEVPLERFYCPVCKKQTVLWLLPNTEIKNLPIKCKRCGKESVISVSTLAERENVTDIDGVQKVK
ncbi:MAG: hypothetical protein IJ946_05095 [Clostridia bacterium]|nr:hypothetical protein [Clostridia bacterium]